MIRNVTILSIFLFSNLLYPQHDTSPLINLQRVEVSLEHALMEIQKQTQVEFVYDSDLIMDKKISCDFVNTPLTAALKSLTCQCDISYQIFQPKSVVFFSEHKKQQTLMGVVVDSVSQQTLPFANVIIKGTNTGVSADNAGRFKIDNIHVDLCTLTVCYIGYNPIEIVTGRFDSASIKAELIQYPIQSEPVIITDHRIPQIESGERAGKIELYLKEIKLLPTAANDDILHALQLMPGAKKTLDRLDGLYIQKGTPDQNLLLLDGITVIRGEHLWGYLHAFNSHAIKSVTLHKAGFSAKHGGQLSSIIELKGDPGSADNMEIGCYLNTFYVNGHLKIPVTSKCRAALSLRRSTDIAGLDEMYYNFEDYIFLLKRRYQTDLNHGNMFTFYDAVAKIEYEFSPENKISLTGFQTYDKIDITKLDKIENVKEGQRFEEWKNQGIGANWDIAWNERFSSQAHVSYSQYKNKYLYQYQLYGKFTFINTADNTVSYFSYNIPIEEHDHNKVHQLNYKFHQSFTLNKLYSLQFGFNLQRTEINNQMPSNHFRHQITNTNDTKYELNILMPVMCSSWSNIAYLENRLNPCKNLNIELGFRNNYYSLLMKSYLEPRLSLSYHFKNFRFDVRWGQYHQFLHRMTVQAGDFNPMRTSYYWTLAYDDLLPEFAEHTAFSVLYQYKQYEFNISGFQKDYDNLVRMTPGIQFISLNKASGFIYIDKGFGFSKGLEFTAKKNSGFLTGWISYQLSTARFRFATINRNEWFNADFDRTHEIKLVTICDHGRWRLSCLNVLASGIPYSTADHTLFSVPIEYDFYSYTDWSSMQNHRLPNYFRTDIKVNYELFQFSKFRMNAGFTLFNIFDRKNIIDQYYANAEDYYKQDKSNIKELDRTVFIFCDFEFK